MSGKRTWFPLPTPGPHLAHSTQKQFGTMRTSICYCLLFFFFFAACPGLSAQSESGEKGSFLEKLFQKQEAEDPLPDDLRSALQEARRDHREAKKDNKQALAEELAAREKLDQLKAQRKAGRLEESAQEDAPPLAGLFSSTDPELKDELQEARVVYRLAKKEQKAASARERLARERVDLLKSALKVQRTEDRAEKAEAKLDETEN